MPTLEDLGRDVKSKYPGRYDDLSDAELGHMVIARYPQYSDYNQKADTIYSNERTYPAPPKAPSHKLASYIGGVVLFILSVFLLFTWSGPAVILGVAGMVGGILLLVAGVRADQREAVNMQSRAGVVSSRVLAETELTNLESARNDAELRRRVNTEATVTQIGQQKLAQQQIKQQGTELELRVQYIPQAAEKRIDVDGFIQTNIQKVLNQIEVDKIRQLNQAETDKQWIEIDNWLKGANLVAHVTGQQRKQLTQDFIDTAKQIALIKRDTELDEEERTLVIERLKKNLEKIEGDLDGLDAGRTLQAANGQTTKRLQEHVAQIQPDYPEGVDADDH
jgi:hypothetical protein